MLHTPKCKFAAWSECGNSGALIYNHMWNTFNFEVTEASCILSGEHCVLQNAELHPEGVVVILDFTFFICETLSVLKWQKQVMFGLENAMYTKMQLHPDMHVVILELTFFRCETFSILKLLVHSWSPWSTWREAQGGWVTLLCWGCWLSSRRCVLQVLSQGIFGFVTHEIHANFKELKKKM